MPAARGGGTRGKGRRLRGGSRGGRDTKGPAGGSALVPAASGGGEHQLPAAGRGGTGPSARPHAWPSVKGGSRRAAGTEAAPPGARHPRFRLTLGGIAGRSVGRSRGAGRGRCLGRARKRGGRRRGGRAASHRRRQEGRRAPAPAATQGGRGAAPLPLLPPPPSRSAAAAPPRGRRNAPLRGERGLAGLARFLPPALPRGGRATSPCGRPAQASAAGAAEPFVFGGARADPPRHPPAPPPPGRGVPVGTPRPVGGGSAAVFPAAAAAAAAGGGGRRAGRQRGG